MGFSKRKEKVKKMKKTKKRKGLLAGLVIGAGLGVLFAPKKGSETRKDLMRKFDELKNKAKDIDIAEVKENINIKIDAIKVELAELDKEKALKIAKKKAKQIKEMAEDLVEYAVEKGTPVLEKSAAAVRTKAIEVTKEVLAKLEEKEK